MINRQCKRLDKMQSYYEIYNLQNFSYNTEIVNIELYSHIKEVAISTS